MFLFVVDTVDIVNDFEIEKIKIVLRIQNQRLSIANVSISRLKLLR